MKNQNGFAIQYLALLLLVIIGVGGVGYKVYLGHTAGKSTATIQLHSNSSTLSVANNDAREQVAKVDGVPISNDTYYALSTSNDQVYYGKVKQIEGTIFQLYPVIYRGLNSSTLVELGNQPELHNPEPALYFSEHNINKISEMDPSSEVYKTMQEFFKSNAVPALTPVPTTSGSYAVMPARYQALFFSDGKVYYGKMKADPFNINALFADTSHVYTLTKNSTGVSLVKVNIGELSSHDFTQLSFWENLKSDGQISKAIDLAIKQGQ